MSTTVHVEGISTQTSEKEVRDFFSFCGKISDLQIKPGSSEKTQNADVTFEKETATKTALLLDGTQLGPSEVKVTASSSTTSHASSATTTEKGENHDDVAQEDKPKARIVAEYLAHGYVISDKAVEAALALDRQHGISARFTSALKSFDERFKATDKAAAVDARFGVSEKANASWRGMNSYFEKALGTPTGQKVRQFYEEGNKQVIDVHNEARHLANLKSPSSNTKPSAEEAGLHTVPGDEKRTQCNCGGAEGKCACEPGKCACSNCNLNKDDAGSKKPSAEEAELHTVPGNETRTQCNCGGAEGKCACEPGKCACSNCNLNKDSTASASEKIPV